MKKVLVIVLIAAFAVTALPLASNAASVSDYDFTVKPIKPVLKIKPQLSIKPVLSLKKPLMLKIPDHVRYSGDYTVEYNPVIDVSIAGGTSSVSLDEIRSGGAMVGSIEIPAEIADQIEEVLADQVNIQIEAKKFGPVHKITLQGDEEGDLPRTGLVNKKSRRFTVARFGSAVSQYGQCAAIGGVVTSGTFDKLDGTPNIDGSSSIGLIFGCEGLLAGAKATVHWDATKIQ